MRKLIMFIFFILSLTTMILFTLSLSDLFSFLGLGSFEIEEIITLIQEMPLETIVSALGTVLWGLFQLYGIPLIVFLVSLNGLSKKS